MAQDRYTCFSGQSLRSGRFSGGSTPTPPPSDYSSFLLFPPGTKGTTYTHFNEIGGLHWRIPGGTWLDNNGTQQGNVPVSSAFVDISAGQQWVEMDVMAFMTRWRTVTNDGMFLKTSDPSKSALYRSREYADPAFHPHLIVTTDAQQYTCACLADTYISSSTSYALGPDDRFKIDVGMIRFDLSQVPQGETVTSATMRVFTFKVYSGDHDLQGYYIDAPVPFDVGATKTGGFATGVTDVSTLIGNPNVVEIIQFDDAGNWRTTPNWEAAPLESGTFSPLQATNGELAVQMPTDNVCNGGGEGTGLSGRQMSGTIPSDGQLHPTTAGPLGPTHLFSRYAVRLDPDWTSVNDRQMTGGKFPGFHGRWGYLRPLSGTYYWQPTHGNGGAPGHGKFFLAGEQGNGTTHDTYAGWSTRMQWYAFALDQPDNPMYQCTPVGWYRYHPGWPVSGTGQDVPWKNVMLVPGRTYEIEEEVQINTVSGPFDTNGNGDGNPDGILRAWVDGVLVWEETDFIFTHHPAIAIQGFWAVFKNGGTLSPCLPHTAYLGPIIVATARIGPTST